MGVMRGRDDWELELMLKSGSQWTVAEFGEGTRGLRERGSIDMAAFKQTKIISISTARRSYLGHTTKWTQEGHICRVTFMK